MEFRSKADEDKAKLRLLTHPPRLERYMTFVETDIPEYNRLARHYTSVNTYQAHVHVQTTASFDGGQLDKLPVELVVEVLSQLDLKSLLKMRSVSHYVQQVVDCSIIPYIKVIKHAPNALAAMHRTGMAAHFTLRDLAGAMYSEKCVHCGDFGPALHLLTCERVCFPCIMAFPKLLPLSKRAARNKYGFDNKTVQALPSLRSIPGRYSVTKNVYKRRLNLVDEVAAYNAGIKYHGSLAAMKFYGRNSVHGRWVDNPIDIQENDARRFMTATVFPSVNRKTDIAERGMCCLSCSYLDRYNIFMRKHGVVSSQEYIEHFEHCASSQHIWHSYPAKNGAIEEGSEDLSENGGST